MQLTTRTRAYLATLALSLMMLTSHATAQQASDPGSRIRGLVKPDTSAQLSSQIPARIVKLPFEDGDRFSKGDVLVEFDCDMFEASLNSAGAEYQAKRRRHANNRELSTLDAIADIEVRVSEAEMRKAAADVRSAKITVERCQIAAPFDGRVAGREVNEFESVAQDQPLMTIIDDSQLEIELIVPSRWLKWLRSGTPFAFLVDETGESHTAVVERISAAVDPVSQTIRVTGVLPKQSETVLAGMSGTASFKQPEDSLAKSGETVPAQ